MTVDFPGLGTLINVLAIIVGALAGMAVGHRLPERTKGVVTDILGLVTITMAGLSTAAVTDGAFRAATGSGAPVLIVLGALLVGGIIGSLLGIERRLGALASVIHARFGGAPVGPSGEVAGPSGEVTHRDGTVDGSAVPVTTDDNGSVRVALSPRERFIEGWLSATLLFCVGPLAVLGSINDGLGRGLDQLVLKSVLDGFAAMAFASTFGIGVLFSAASVAIVQGLLTVLGMGLGEFLPEAHIAALTATGGVMLAGIGLRLLRIRDIPVGDMLPALVVAPLLTTLVVALR